MTSSSSSPVWVSTCSSLITGSKWISGDGATSPSSLNFVHNILKKLGYLMSLFGGLSLNLNRLLLLDLLHQNLSFSHFNVQKN